MGAAIHPRKAYTPQPDGQTAAAGAGADRRNMMAFCLLLLRLLIVITTAAREPGPWPGQAAPPTPLFSVGTDFLKQI